MTNIYIQKRYGECGYVAVANAFDLPKVIPSDEETLNKGMNCMVFRRLIESATDYTVINVFLTQNTIDYYIPVFEWDEEILDGAADFYCLFFVTVKMPNTNTHHCLLVIKENFNDTLIVLDPYFKESSTINMKYFFQKYNVTEIELVCNKEHGGTMFFDESNFKHLL